LSGGAVSTIQDQLLQYHLYVGLPASPSGALLEVNVDGHTRLDSKFNCGRSDRQILKTNSRTIEESDFVI
jgi:hypothetical protein